MIPAIVAMWHTDAHVTKMILESAQLLYTCWRMTNEEKLMEIHPVSSGDPRYNKIYKTFGKNHPVSKWLRESRENYIWLTQLAQELCKEKVRRTSKVHSCSIHIDWLADNIPPSLPHTKMTPPALAITCKKLHPTDAEGNIKTKVFAEDMENGIGYTEYTFNEAIEAYQRYYCLEKFVILYPPTKTRPNPTYKMSKWSTREVPEWFCWGYHHNNSMNRIWIGFKLIEFKYEHGLK